MLDDSLFYGLVIVMVGITSFGLGRLSVLDFKEKEDDAIIFTTQEIKNEADTQVVVSKNGSKYHYLWCPGAKQIKEVNKLYFSSQQEAEGAGYTRAANCPEM